MIKAFVSFLVFCMAASPAFSQNRPDGGAAIDYETAHLSRIATAVRITDKITLDGKLDEEAWKRALPATDFTQQQPHTGEISPERTEVRFLYDGENLYVGLWCFDSDPERITINDLREDFNFNESDSVSLYIDSLFDHHSGVSLIVNAAGARRDSQVTNDTQFNGDWDAVWDVKATRNSEGWVAEYMIPFKTLRFSQASKQIWGLNIARRILRLNEESFWAPQPVRYGSGSTTLMGTLDGIENIQPGRNLKVKPFITAGVAQTRNAAGNLETTQSLTRLKDYDGGVDLKYSLTPSLTLDATYHTDFAQVEADQQQVNLTRFNLFFPEKRDFFLENAGLFNFGSAGNGSNLVPFFSRRIGLSAAGRPVPIVGGTRVTGKINRYDVGFLAMKTESSGTTPSNNFLVGRLKRNLLRNSWVGALMTNRESTIAGDYNRVYGGDAHFRFFNKWEVDSYLLASNTPGKPGNNQARRFETGWRGDEFVAVGQYNSVQPNFRPDVGFIRRSNVTQYRGDITWKPLLRNNDTIRNFDFGTSLDYNGGTGSGKIETREQNFTAGVQFENNGMFHFTTYRNFDRLAAPLRVPSGDPHIAIARGDYRFRGYTANMVTNTGAKINGTAGMNWGGFYNGNRRSFAGGVNVRPNYHLTVNLTYERNKVTVPNGSFTTNLVGTRLLYAFTARSYINAFIQYNADTHQISSNIRFDLIHHPLSDLYIVYNQTRDTQLGQLREHAFIVKLTNLFNF